jgi:hypothetical protein
MRGHRMEEAGPWQPSGGKTLPGLTALEKP